MRRQVFKTRFFARWSRKAAVPDTALCVAVDEMERGLIDADLGGHLYKKRIAVEGRGKRGGARVIVAVSLGRNLWIFLTGYLKNDQPELDRQGLADIRGSVDRLLLGSENVLAHLIAKGELEEICHV
ncbi:MAG: type II toxin-antitoxin system RelE/ParE family toxin [bacterium]